MKIKHKKLLLSGIAVITAGVLGAGALFESSVSVQASAAMMPGIETIVKNSTEKKPFRILELVDDSEDAEIGYYVSGQEPSLKLYEYQYQDADNVTRTIRFSTLEEGLEKLPEKRRKEFAMNVKLKEDGSVDENADIGIRKIRDIAGAAGADSEKSSPLTYSDYQEKYFPGAGEGEKDGWKKLELRNFDGSSRTDTVTLNGNYVEDDAGDYTKQQQEYHPIRKDVEQDNERPEKYRENIRNFYFSEGDDVRGSYYLQFEEVDNATVNNALKDENDRGQKTILPEYDYPNGKYGYYENVYTDLTDEIVKNIEEGKYTFPGEQPEDASVALNGVLVQDNGSPVTEQESSDYDDGTVKSRQPSEEFQDDQPEVESSEVQAGLSDDENGFGAGESGDFSDDTTDIQSDEENPEIQDQEQPDSGAPDEDELEIQDINEDTTTQSRVLGALKNPASAGSQTDPYIYLGESMEQYPFYKYTLIGDLDYIRDQVQYAQEEDQKLADQGQEAVRKEGDITLADGQYWYWKDDGTGNMERAAVSVVTGKQPVEYEDIQSIPEDFLYNYYYKVEKVWFCCRRSADGSDTDPSAFANFGWYYPSYPENEDPYLKVEDGDGKTATHYTSDAEYKLTPGNGNYSFVQGDGSACQVEVDHFYYQGGYVNNDWLKRYVFHLSPEDEEFKNLNIQVDTKKASDFSEICAVQTEADTEDLALEDAPATDSETLSSAAENSDTGILADYDLIYINGTLSDTTAAFFRNSTVPCIINSSRLTSGSALQEAFNAFIRDDDADGSYVNHYVYVFRNTQQSGAENCLANTAFHTNFNPDADKDSTDTFADAVAGFEEILNYVESENKYRSLGVSGADSTDSSDQEDTFSDGSREALEPLTKEISQARALEYIINYQYKRQVTTKAEINVLEIEPDKCSPELTADAVRKWLGDDKSADASEIDAITDSSQNINIKTMTASEFVGHVDDILSDYDMVYIGGTKNSDSDPLITGGGSSRYVHVGSGVQIQSNKKELLKLLGQLDNEYDQSYSGSNGTKRFAPLNTYGPDGGGYLRGSGNDMTKHQSQELLDFVKSGYPVVISSELLTGDRKADSSKVDTSSYYYSFIRQALEYDNVFESSQLGSGKKDIRFFSELAKPVIKFDENGGRPAEAAGVDDFSDESSGTIRDELGFTFTVENDSDAAPAISTYNCNLYIDLNFDGVFSEKEKQDKYMVVQDESGNVLTQVKYGEDDYRYELKMGQKYTVIRKIPSDYFKLITWKLEAVSNRNSYVHTSETGYSRQQNTSGQKQTIRVLQLIPTNCTWTLSSSRRFNELLSEVQDFNIVMESKTVTEINQYTQAQMRELLRDKQMLIIGFADVYQDISNANHQADEILDFVKSGKSTLFAHDTTSYINYDYNKLYRKIASTQYGVDENTDVYYDAYLHRSNINNVTWGLSLNTVLRSVTGMDRYGIVSDKQLSNGMTVSQLLKQGKGLTDGSSVTFKELMEKAGDIAYKTGDQGESYAQTQAYTNNLLNQYQLGSNGTTTTSISRINEGAITQYPYKMGDKLNIAVTHGQYYQLGLEQDCDINGNSDGKTDIVVWYALSGSIYDKSPNDVRNNYYLYSKGNVIYTGAGHSAVTGDDEIRLFINAIVAAANVTAVQPEVSFVNTLDPSARTESVHYYMTDQSTWTTGEANTLETNADLNINVKDYNMVSADLDQDALKDQEMVLKFYIEDENGQLPDNSIQNTLPSELRNRKLTDITEKIGSLIPYGKENEPLYCSADGKFHNVQNTAYSLTVPGIETYLRKTEEDGTQDYRKSCKVWAQVSSTVYLYGEPKTSTVWASIDLKQRQLFDLD